MTVVLASPIDRVYTSHPSYRQNLWLRRENFVFDGPLAPLNHGKQATALETPCIKVAKWPELQSESLLAGH